MDEQIKIAAVDDHPMFLDGLRRALRRAPDLSFVAEGYSAADACRIAEEVKPDVLLLDIGIPGGGLAAARAIKSTVPSVHIVMLTASDADEAVAEALSAGAKGYLLKGAGATEVIEAIRSVRSEVPYISIELASRMLVQKVVAERSQRQKWHTRVKLSEREQNILDFASQGMTNKEIADKLGLSVRTVKRQMSTILQKLQVRSRLEAAITPKRG